MKVFTASLTLLTALGSVAAFADEPKVVNLPFVHIIGDQTEFVKNLAKDPKATFEMAAGYMTITLEDKDGKPIRLISPASEVKNAFGPAGRCKAVFHAVFDNGNKSKEVLWGDYITASQDPSCKMNAETKEPDQVIVDIWDLNEDMTNKSMAMVALSDKADDADTNQSVGQNQSFIERLYDSVRGYLKGKN